jgi:hypothetical protein
MLRTRLKSAQLLCYGLLSYLENLELGKQLSFLASNDYAFILNKHRIVIGLGARKLGFPHAEELLRQLSAIRAHVLKTVCQSCPKPCKFKEHRFEEATVCLGPDLAPEKASYSTTACVLHVVCTCTSAVPSRVCAEHCTRSLRVDVINAEQMGLDDISGHAH